MSELHSDEVLEEGQLEAAESGQVASPENAWDMWEDHEGSGVQEELGKEPEAESSKDSVSQVEPEKPNADLELEQYKAALAAKELELNRLRQEQLAWQRNQQGQAVQQVRTVQPRVEPETVADFLKEFPEAKDLLFEDSKAGASVRRKLEVLGIDEAADYALPILESRQQAAYIRQSVNKQSEVALAEANAVATKQYWDSVNAAHPDVCKVLQGEYKGKLIEELTTWAQHKPYLEAQAVFKVIHGNPTAEETNKILRAWKEEILKPTGVDRQKVAAQMSAVSSRSPKVATSATSKLDPWDMWEERDKRGK